jgi:hypothetical protein
MGIITLYVTGTINLQSLHSYASNFFCNFMLPKTTAKDGFKVPYFPIPDLVMPRAMQQVLLVL